MPGRSVIFPGRIRLGTCICRCHAVSCYSLRDLGDEVAEPIHVQPYCPRCRVNDKVDPLAGVTYDIVDQVKISSGQESDLDMDSPHSAIEVRKSQAFLFRLISVFEEMAISTQAKAFLASPVSQKVVHDIY